MKIVFITDQLLKVNGYREFLKNLYTENKKIHKGFSYSFIASKSGIASKGFIKEVIEEKKNLTINTAERIAEGLSFPAVWKAYFLCLYFLDQDQRSDKKSSYLKENERLKQKILQMDNKTVTLKQKDFFEFENWSIIYAALGSYEKGADVDSIMSRTQLGQVEVEQILKVFLENGLVSEKRNRYYCVKQSVFLENLNQSQFFKKFFLRSLNQLYIKADKNFTSEENMYYSMAFSVKSKDTPQFKKELIDLLDKFSTSAEVPDGDRVAILTCGLHLV